MRHLTLRIPTECRGKQKAEHLAAAAPSEKIGEGLVSCSLRWCAARPITRSAVIDRAENRRIHLSHTLSCWIPLIALYKPRPPQAWRL